MEKSAGEDGITKVNGEKWRISGRGMVVMFVKFSV
jgi:hypothetical protein